MTVQVASGIPASFVLHGLSLLDSRTGAHTSITVSPRGDFRRIHSGDVKVYRRENAPGRAWLVHGAQPVADDTAALALLADPGFDPRSSVAIKGNAAFSPPAAATAGEHVAVIAYEAERIVLQAQVSSPGYLVVADAYYPGWQATVDGRPATIQQANLMFRAIRLEPGAHEVRLSYRPAGWLPGLAISLGTLICMVGALAVSVGRR